MDQHSVVSIAMLEICEGILMALQPVLWHAVLHIQPPHFDADTPLTLACSSPAVTCCPARW
jgi:hypothetical protein